MTRSLGLISLLSMGALCLLTACNQPMSAYPELTDAEIVAEEKEQHKMLNHYASEGGAPRPWRKRKGITKQFNRVADKIEKAGAKVCQELGIPSFDMRCYFYFRLVRGNELNAWADGENIRMTYGMMHFLNNDDEVAMVLAHEYAHNLMGHLAAAENNMLIGAVLGAALEGLAGTQGIDMGGGVVEDAARVGAIAYSPSFEREADYIGLYVLSRAGYNPNKAKDIWRRFTVEDPEGVYGSETHPSNPERFVLLQRTIDEINEKKKARQPLLPNMSPEFMAARQ